MSTIGERLKNWRKSNNLSMKNVEAKTGIGTSNLSAIERNKIQPSAKALIALKYGYSLNTDWILTGEIANISESPSNYNTSYDPRYEPILNLLKDLDDRELIKLEHEIENAKDKIIARRAKSSTVRRNNQ